MGSYGKEMRQMEEAEESMWGKTYDKLKKLDYIWKKQHKKSIDDKRKMKELISDISHQTRTPAANMKLYLEILKQEDLTQEERTYYFGKTGNAGRKTGIFYGKSCENVAFGIRGSNPSYG